MRSDFAISACITLALLSAARVQAQQYVPEMGRDIRPGYEMYRMDNIASQGEAGYSGDLSLSIPILTVPGRKGHDFDIRLNYSSSITQRQKASWVGLGWSLDLGAVERSIIGRADDQVQGLFGTYNLCESQTNVCKAEMKGRLDPLHPALNHSDKDQADSYKMIVDNSGMEILPFPATQALGEQLNPLSFLPSTYKPCRIEALWTPTIHPYIMRFDLTKEDGIKYMFGDGSGNADFILATGYSDLNSTPQSYQFPYRWNLTRIDYPDGSATTIRYNNHNYGELQMVSRQYEPVMIDRSMTVGHWERNIFEAGSVGWPNTQDMVKFAYSSPDTVFTDTHYAVFVSAQEDGAERNRRLDEIILYERGSDIPLKQAIFTYAAETNSSNYWHQSQVIPEWNEYQKLNDNQLTLKSVEVQGIDGPEPIEIPAYTFAYYWNPKVSDENLTMRSSQGDENFTGEFLDTVFATAWRLKQIGLPTGGTIQYFYERLNNASFDVQFDPEGNPATEGSFSQRHQPRCRLIRKVVTDPLSVNQTWSYEYGDAVFDAPTRLTWSSFVPKIYRGAGGVFVDRPLDYHKFFRGCPIGHRWVKVNNPDGSWKKTWYTSSYQHAGFDPLESFPDSIVTEQPPQPHPIVAKSQAGKRGLAWKEETASTQIIRKYNFLEEGAFLDRFQYHPTPGAGWDGDMIVQTSINPQLVEESNTIDGITSTVLFLYNPSPRFTMPGNGQVSLKVEKGPDADRETSFRYACEEYPGMFGLSMLSQLYSKTVRKTISGYAGDDEEKAWTKWAEVYADRWLPVEEWVWDVPSSEPQAPGDPGETGTIRIASYSYDESGFACITSNRDANGALTSYFYGDVDPFENSTAGLSRSYLTGARLPLPEPVNVNGPGPFTLSSPPDEGAEQGMHPYLTWTSSDGADSYDVYLDIEHYPITRVAQGLHTTQWQYHVSQSNSNRIHHWKVIARNVDGSTVASNAPFWFCPGEGAGPYNMGELDSRISFAYDHYGNLKEKVDENGDTTSYEYDPLGRLFKVFGPQQQLLMELAYEYSSPNFIRTTTFRSQTESIVSISFYDGLGYEIQRQISSGAADLVWHTTYDPMRRICWTYKPYEATLPTPHWYDPNVVENANAHHQNTGGYPYTRNEYYTDGTSRPRHIHPPGQTFQQEQGLGFASHEYSSSSFGNNIGVDPSETVFCDAGWAMTGGTTIDQVLRDGASPNDNTYAVIQGLTGTIEQKFRVRVNPLPSVTDSTAYYVARFRYCGQQFQNGPGSINAQLTFRLLEGTTIKGSKASVIEHMPTSFMSDSFVVACSSIQNPSDILVEVLADGDFDPSNQMRVSWARVEVCYPTFYKHLIADENSNQTVEYKDIFGNVVRTVSDPGLLNLTTRFDHDILGRVTKTTTPGNQMSTFAYNTRGRVTEKTSPDAGSVRYKYDRKGNVRFQQDGDQLAAGKFIYHKYDHLSRLVETGIYEGDFTTANPRTTCDPTLDFPLSGGNPVVQNVYDAVDGDLPSRNLLGRLAYSTTTNDGVTDSVFFSYDDFSRVEWQLHHLSGIASKKTVHTYDLQGNVVRFGYLDLGNANNNTWFFYEYDQAGRLSKVFTSLDSSGVARVQEADYKYLPNGQVKRMQAGLAQGVDYLHNERDWLTSINHQNLNIYQDPGGDGANGIPVDRFGMVLGYHNVEHIGAAQGASAQFNGNISWVMYNMSGVTNTGPGDQTPLVGYSFKYDPANRLTRANFGKYVNSWTATAAYDLDTMTYDRNGNFAQMIRVGTNATPMDNLAYHYSAGTNKLEYVTDQVAANTYSADIDNQSQGNYVYDLRGNMTRDNQANMDIAYDYRNLPLHVTRNGVTTHYRYDANGKRTYKSVANGETVYYIYDAAGRNIAVLNANGSIRMLNIHGADHIGYLAVSYDQGHIEEEEQTDGPASDSEEESPIAPENPPDEGVVGGEGVVDNEGSQVPQPDSTSTEVLVTGPGGRIDKRFYYLKDHLGSVRATVQSGHLMLWEDFNTNLDQWRFIEGTGFQISNGRLGNADGGEQLIIDRAPRVLDDGIVTVDVRFNDEIPVLDDPYSEPQVALLIRYRNPEGYYAVGFSNNDIALYRRTLGGFQQVVYEHISTTGMGVLQKLQVTTEGNRLMVFWNGEYIFHWDDPNPWLTGKVGFRHRESQAVEWDNIRVTTGGPGKIVAYDDYDPWGMVLEGRSANLGNGDAKFKFLTKEHDVETGYDWLDARGYDSRIGRFMTVDPLADQSNLRSWSPYHYSFDNPTRFKDPSGLRGEEEGEDEENETKVWERLKRLADNAMNMLHALTSSSLPPKENALVAGSSASNITTEVKEGLTEGALSATEKTADVAGNVEVAASVGGGVSMLGGPTTAPLTASLFAVSGTAGAMRFGAMLVNRIVGGETYSTPEIALQSLSVATPVAVELAFGRGAETVFTKRVQSLGFSGITIMNRLKAE